MLQAHPLRYLCLALLTAATPATAVAEDIDFNRDVRPILSDACFACHGPDSGHRQADLRLDLKEGLFQSTDGVTIVDKTSPQDSELVRRILSDDPDVVMPPHAGSRRLTDKEKQTIQQWIAQGAQWKGHWAYIAPIKSAVPAADAPDVNSNGNAIDRFIQAQLATKKLTALPQADPVTLVRRLCLDLTGLPPSTQQVAAFRADSSLSGWNSLLDELLASQHYAERMTAMWLDLVRYADTNGIHGDNHREVWMYRDYVIKAFHQNMPFDQFTIEQIAGDLLPDATDQQKIASGYNRLLMTTREGGAQPKEYLAKYSADRVRNASTVWMGATMGCCECHDHKFDPYSIRDFYQFAAFFADIQDVAVGTQPSVKMPSPDQKMRADELSQQLAELQKTLDTQTPELDAALSNWVADVQKKIKAATQTWSPANVVDMQSEGGQEMSQLDDGSILTAATQPKHDTYRVSLAANAGRLTGLRLETLQHDSFVRKSLARKPGNGNFVLSGVRVIHVQAADSSQHDIPLADAIASYEQKSWPVKNALDGKPDTGWAVDGHHGELKNPVAVFQLQAPLELKDADQVIVELQQNAVDFHNIGRFRISTSNIDQPGLSDDAIGLPADLVAVVADWTTASPEQQTAVAVHFRTTTELLAPQRQQLAEVQTQQTALEKQYPETLITLTQAARPIRVLARGDWMDDSGDVVKPSVPEFLPQLSTAGNATRLDLAHWFLAEQNPLVARVFVNRLWKMLFGKGLVKSSDDFGSQGAWPTHPKLLDWLAVEFRDSGWDVQHIIRLIVASDAYRRSSVAGAKLVEADPFNDWLARQSRYRIDAEFIRDGALSVSGLLVDRVGGRSVKPYQPAGYWAHLNFPKRTWTAETGDDQYRRGLYTYWCRTFLHPAMRSFDAPSREECTVDRPRSNNSLQALVLLNDPSYVEAARALAGRTILEGGDTTIARLEYMFEQCLNRLPTAPEQTVMLDVLNTQQDEFATSADATTKFLSVGLAPAATGVDPAELAAWTSVARVLLNLHETITRS